MLKTSRAGGIHVCRGTLRLEGGIHPSRGRPLEQDRGVTAQSLLSSPVLRGRLSPGIHISVIYRRGFPQRKTSPLLFQQLRLPSLVLAPSLAAPAPLFRRKSAGFGAVGAQARSCRGRLDLAVRNEPSAAQCCRGRVSAPEMCLAEPGRDAPSQGR